MFESDLPCRMMKRRTESGLSSGDIIYMPRGDSTR